MGHTRVFTDHISMQTFHVVAQVFCFCESHYHNYIVILKSKGQHKQNTNVIHITNLRAVK